MYARVATFEGDPGQVDETIDSSAASRMTLRRLDSKTPRE